MSRLPLSNNQIGYLEILKLERGRNSIGYRLPAPTGDSLTRLGLARKLGYRDYVITDAGLVTLDLVEQYFAACTT